MFLPPTIDLGNSEKYILTIRIKPTSFMFSLTEPEVGKNYCLRGTTFEQGEESLLDNIKKIIFDLNFLTYQYAQTNVIFVSPDYVFAPTELYESRLKADLYNFTSLAHEAFVLTDQSPKYDLQTLYEVDEEVYEFLARSLFSPHFYHHTTSLIHLLEGRSSSTNLHAKMYVNLHDGMTDIMCFSGNKFLSGQSYEDLSPSEKSYYILKTWESLGLNQLTDQLLIAGDLEDEVLDVLREYIKIIERLSAPSEVFLWHKDAQKAPLDLISLSL